MKELTPQYQYKLSTHLESIEQEVKRAKGIHKGEFNSLHEGYGVLKEEVDELWDEIKKKEPVSHCVREEAKQVAAMCLRIMVELT